MTVIEATAPSKVETALAELGVAVDDLRSTEGWVRYLEVARRMHHYSWNNLMLIAVQCPDATQVAGYKAWLKLGRQVQKGEKSIRILAPMIRKNDVGEHKIFGFKLASVFDISQTEGDALAERPEWPLATGDVTEEAYVAIVGHLESVTDVRVELVDDGEGPSGARGWYVPDQERIFLRAGHEPVQRVATLLHELGHHFDPGLELGGRADKEQVAECVSYLAAPHFGVEKADCTLNYLAGWGGTSDALLAVGKRVQKAYAEVERVFGADVEVDDV